MGKARTIDISQTNIAGLGTELEKQVRLNAALTEAAWKGVGQKPGLIVWRIEKFHIVPWPESDYGKFYSGDSYIILNTWKKPDSPALYHDVHFWLGLQTTQDEAGTAAYKTVELDDFLNGAAVQYREVQGFESTRFISYFKNLFVMEGGIESGFRHVKPEDYVFRLLQVKGVKGKLVVRQVPLSFQSLNSGDVFILDAGLKIYQWNGSSSSGQEKQKAVEFSHAIANERKVAKVFVFDEGDRDANEFWTGLGGQGPVKSASEGGRDSVVTPQDRKLFRISDASGQFTTILEATGRIKKQNFDTNDAFIFDAGTEVYAWIGLRASKTERSKGLQSAVQYLAEHNRPITTHVSRVIEGGESESFLASLDK